MRKIFLPLLFICLIIPGCVKLGGEFAFKKSVDDKYRKIDCPLEFEKTDKIKWVYIFNDIKRRYSIGVSLLKKEIVWVDISNRVVEIKPEDKIIYGDIEDLTDGTYKIILTESGKIIKEIGFIIFSDQEEDYKYNK